MDFHKGTKFPFEQDNETQEYRVYDRVEKEWRYLNFFEYLQARVPRIKTSDNKTHFIMPYWSGLQNGFTLLFKAFILKLAQGMPVHQVCNIIKISYHKVWYILDKYTTITQDINDYSKVIKVCLDEISISKYRDYVSLFVDLDKRKAMYVTEGKHSQAVESFAEYLKKHGGETSNITDISCDMSPAFVKGAKKSLRDSKITLDKFHVLKIINKAIDEVRGEE